MSKDPKVPAAGAEAKKPASPPAEPAAPAAPARPRAQVAYEGDDEFSVMSARSKKRKPTVELAPVTPPVAEAPKPAAEEGKSPTWHFIRKIFGQ